MLYVLMVTAMAHAGWTQPDGGHYVKFGARVIVGRVALPAGLAFPSPDNTIDIDTIVDGQLNYYGEYGLSDAWTLVTKADPLGIATHGSDSMVYTGIYQVGVRRGLASGTHNVAVQVDANYTPPVGEDDLIEGVYPGLVYIPAIHTARGLAHLSYGVGFGSAWFGASAGVEVPTHPDLLPSALGWLKIGRHWKNRHLLSFNVPIRKTLGSYDEVSNIAGAGNRDFVAWNIAYTYRFGQKGWGVATQFDAAFVLGSNLGGGVIPLAFEHVRD